MLEQSEFKRDLELADRETIKYMLERLQGQQSQETAMIRDLDPYFNF